MYLSCLDSNVSLKKIGYLLFEASLEPQNLNPEHDKNLLYRYAGS